MIKEYGEVIVRENETIIQFFTFDFNSRNPSHASQASKEAMDWAIKRLQEELAKEETNGL